MFTRLFGETEIEQLEYLKKRILITLILLVIDIVLFIITGSGGITVFSCYIWGWGALKALFGFTALGVLFSRNVVLAAIFIVLFVFIGAFAGFVCMLLGIGRFIYLKAAHSAPRG